MAGEGTSDPGASSLKDQSYSVKSIVYTLQGEGANAGRPAVFLRFSGCNLWSGREWDRASAICQFCDTDFVGTNGPGGGRFERPEELALAVTAKWPPSTFGRPLVVCTGGEPLLQLDPRAIEALHEAGFQVAVETNGTRAAPLGIDWLCVSPKARTDLVQQTGDELKVVFPQPGLDLLWLFTRCAFKHYYLSPMDGPRVAENSRLALDYCLAHPEWSLSLQTHKFLGIP